MFNQDDFTIEESIDYSYREFHIKAGANAHSDSVIDNVDYALHLEANGYVKDGLSCINLYKSVDYSCYEEAGFQYRLRENEEKRNERRYFKELPKNHKFFEKRILLSSICGACGLLFKDFDYKKRKYCSNKCSYKGEAKRKSITIHKIKCESCDSYFETRYKSKKYCNNDCYLKVKQGK